jgi:hypothetical protein
MLKLNVGLNRKVGEPNYGSRGGSFHMEVELDNSLMQEPERLRETVSRLFAMVRQSLEQELGGEAPKIKTDQPVQVAFKPEGQSLQETVANHGKQATAKQLGFLQSLAKTQRRNLEKECLDEYETFPERLTSKQASQLIEKWRASLTMAR